MGKRQGRISSIQCLSEVLLISQELISLAVLCICMLFCHFCVFIIVLPAIFVVVETAPKIPFSPAFTSPAPKETKLEKTVREQVLA